MRTCARPCAPPRRALSAHGRAATSPSSPHPPRLGRHAAPTARRSRVWVRAGEVVGVIGERRDRPSAGVEPVSAEPWSNPTRIRSNPQHGAAHASQSLLHRASRCRPLGALVGALSSRCDAAALAAGWAGWFRPRRYFLTSCSPCAAAALLCSSTSGRKVSAGACAGGSRQTPGRRAGDAAREAAAGRAAGRAAGDFPPRLALEACSGSRLKRKCDPVRRSRPRPCRFTSCPGPRSCF